MSDIFVLVISSTQFSELGLCTDVNLNNFNTIIQIKKYKYIIENKTVKQVSTIGMKEACIGER